MTATYRKRGEVVEHGDVRCYWRGCRLATCRAAQAQYHRDLRARTGRTRADNLRAAHDMTLDEYAEMFEAQGGVCAACRQPETGRNMYGVVSLAVDHNHETGERRGLLCMRCNRSLGLLDDSAELLIALAAYRLEYS